jgi:cytochrome c556
MILTTLFVGAAAFPAKSHDHATGVVKERMDLMEVIGKRIKAINRGIKSKQGLLAIKDHARAIAASAPHIVHLFPPGSTQSPTEAKATIWQNFDDFERRAKALEAQSAKLSEMDVSDYTAIAAQARAVSQTCSGCHEVYRIKQ